MQKQLINLKQKLGSNNTLFIIYASLAAFATYSSMYAFRKPFTVLTFEGTQLWNIDFKILIITSQILGYTISKFLGIKIVSEMKNSNRGLSIVILVLLAELSLLGFALFEGHTRIMCMFLNGLPLGMIWGVVFSYLEGRRFTEILGSFLSVSFIVASGFVKSVGLYLINFGVPELWMPFATGLVFLPVLLFSVYMLELLPPPGEEDIRLRTKRIPMKKRDRLKMIKEFLPGIFSLVTVYIILTVFRDFRDNFITELWLELGLLNDPLIFSITEIPIALCVLAFLALIFKIKENLQAFNTILYTVAFGCIITGVSSLMFHNGIIQGVMWMTISGAGLFFSYVPFNAILFERMISTFKYSGNVGFLIYIADSFGYLGSLTIYFYKNFFQSNLEWTIFFTYGSYIVALAGIIFMTTGIIYFNKKYRASKGIIKNHIAIGSENSINQLQTN